MGNSSQRARVTVDGKFFRLGREKFPVKGVTYGPFPPNRDGEPFGSREQTARDFAQIRELGANVLRLYCVPPRWFIELALEHGLRLLVDVPWNKQACFLDRDGAAAEARRAVHAAALACAAHPAVFAISVVNEIPPDIVRWSGAEAIASFIEDLVGLVKAVDADCLCTFGNFPPTEYLRPGAIDFVCFNVYLHQSQSFRNYLSRLQMLADTKPLLLGETGIDSLREGEGRQAEVVVAKIESAFRGGVAGVCVYSFTDEWYKDGRLIEDWQFGLTTRDRRPKPVFAAVQSAFATAPYFDPIAPPRVSVVVACYNGARTLNACLDSLERLRYPAYEVILVDDGSSDATPAIAAAFPRVRYLRHDRNRGLSEARNTGIVAADGEIIAFTDADCRADEDWLHYLVADLVGGRFTGIGGHNLLPADDSCVASAVLVSPGGPAHVMLTDRVAEHIPGCNMAFWKWALLEIGCFDPVFQRAGDDVDVCWRLQQRGYQLGFSPAGFVWHYRRSTVRDYLKQQHGYGEAEALLERKHPEYFNPFGGSIWRGRIYSPTNAGLVARRPMIYHGLFGTALFQSLYKAPPPSALMLVTSLEYHVFATLPLLVLSPLFRWLLPLGLASLVMSLGVCVAAGAQAEVPRRKRRLWSGPLVALLYALQPIVRGWARYQGRLFLRQTPLSAYETLTSLSREQQDDVPDELGYWAEPGFGRSAFLAAVLARLDRQGWQHRTDTGWNRFDVEVYGSRWSKLQFTTVSEYASDGHQVLRGRFRPALTLPARTGFWVLFGVVLLVLGLLGRDYPWLWGSLLVLPAFALWLSQQQRDLQRLMGVFLDEVAKDLGLVRIPGGAHRPPASRGSSGPTNAPGGVRS